MWKLESHVRCSRFCFCINKGWCTDAKVLTRNCSVILVTSRMRLIRLTIKCKRLYSPEEFSPFCTTAGHDKLCAATTINQPSDNQLKANLNLYLKYFLGNFEPANLSH